MASFGHVAVGLAAGRSYSRAPTAWRMLLFSVLALLPDLDVLGQSLGVPYGATWGHRGASHSLLVALALGLLCGLVAWRVSGVGLRMGVAAALTVASHGLLDSLTNGGRGAALLWPFDATRYFAPIRPIPVSPIGRGMLSGRGLYVIVVELILFAPFWLYALWPRALPSAVQHKGAR